MAQLDRRARAVTGSRRHRGASRNDRLGLLSGAPQATSSRHHSLQSVVEWSLTLLSEPTNRLFERLAVFTGSFGIDAAAQVRDDSHLVELDAAGHSANLEQRAGFDAAIERSLRRSAPTTDGS